MSAPLLPPEVDLRDFPYMPLDIVRLFGSAFHARASDAEWRAGVTLWLKSFHQVPAASLPDDDIDLARLAELGRDVRSWRKLRAMALHGWVKGDDGRLYHPVVAEKALEAWIEKLGQRKSSGAANAKRWGAEFDACAVDAQIGTAVAKLTALNPHSRALRRRPPKTATGSPDGSADVVPSGSQEKGRERDREREQEKPRAAESRPDAGSGGAAPSLEIVCREAAGLVGVVAPALGNTEPIERLMASGISLDGVILPALKATLAAGRRGRSWAYYLPAIEERRSSASAPTTAVSDGSVWIIQDSDEGRAWEAHERDAGRLVKWIPSRRGTGRPMPSLWPPGHEPREVAA